mgnify:CR=1 FL=1
MTSAALPISLSVEPGERAEVAHALAVVLILALIVVPLPPIMLDLFLADDRSETVRTIYNASRALIVKSETGPRLLMLDGTSQQLNRIGQRLSITRPASKAVMAAPAVNASSRPRQRLSSKAALSSAA